jgi:hypothetical protein
VKKLGTLLLILVAGAAILAPIIMLVEPDPLPGDFILAWNSQHYPVPVLWSLCASSALTLLYFLHRR